MCAVCAVCVFNSHSQTIGNNALIIFLIHFTLFNGIKTQLSLCIDFNGRKLYVKQHCKLI